MYPSGNSNLASSSPLKTLAFGLPFKISNDLPWGRIFSGNKRMCLNLRLSYKCPVRGLALVGFICSEVKVMNSLIFIYYFSIWYNLELCSYSGLSHVVAEKKAST